MRRRRARRPDPRAHLRSRGRARAGLQHGLPQIGPGGDRRLRRALPGRRRRRRRLLAPAGIGPHARLQRRCGGDAPPPRLGPPLPRQQYGYGEAEALLERKWPSRYNRAGSSRWSGRIYDSPATGPSRRRPMIRYGTWGGGLFQSIYEPAPGTFSSFLLAPECLLLIGALGLVSALGTLWSPLLLALPGFCVGAIAVSSAGVLRSAGRQTRRCRAARPGDAPAPRPDRAALLPAAGGAPGRPAATAGSRPGADACGPAQPGRGRARSRSGVRAGRRPRPASSSFRTRWRQGVAWSAAAAPSTAGTSSSAPARSAGSRSAPRSRSTAPAGSCCGRGSGRGRPAGGWRR